MNSIDSAGPIKSLGGICLDFSIMVLKFSFFFLESMVIEFMLSGFDVFHHPFALSNPFLILSLFNALC